MEKMVFNLLDNPIFKNGLDQIKKVFGNLKLKDLQHLLHFIVNNPATKITVATIDKSLIKADKFVTKYLPENPHMDKETPDDGSDKTVKQKIIWTAKESFIISVKVGYGLTSCTIHEVVVLVPHASKAARFLQRNIALLLHDRPKLFKKFDEKWKKYTSPDFEPKHPAHNLGQLIHITVELIVSKFARFFRSPKLFKLLRGLLKLIIRLCIMNCLFLLPLLLGVALVPFLPFFLKEQKQIIKVVVKQIENFVSLFGNMGKIIGQVIELIEKESENIMHIFTNFVGLLTNVVAFLEKELKDIATIMLNPLKLMTDVKKLLEDEEKNILNLGKSVVDILNRVKEFLVKEEHNILDMSKTIVNLLTEAKEFLEKIVENLANMPGNPLKFILTVIFYFLLAIYFIVFVGLLLLKEVAGRFL